MVIRPGYRVGEIHLSIRLELGEGGLSLKIGFGGEGCYSLGDVGC
jgi:hypothetical protein